MSENLRRDLKMRGSNIKKEHLIYIRLPKDEDHKEAKVNPNPHYLIIKI